MNTTSQPLVSVITPVYNGAEYLAECIESVLAQTYQNWDYTIVDNCSVDGSREIALKYAARDPRIRLITTERYLRVIANHNRALCYISASSKYCKIVFADDWIFPECLERMVAVAERNPSVGMVGAYNLHGTEVGVKGLAYPSTRVLGREICRRTLLGDFYGLGSANCVLYRADLVRSQAPFYNEANVHADHEALFTVLKNSDLGFVHQVLTFTRERPGTLSTISTDRGTYHGCLLHVLVTYGPAYLTAEELEACLIRQLSKYYRFLARNLVTGRDAEFWKYHKERLAEAGLRFGRFRLSKGVVAMLWEAVRRPKDTAEALVKFKRLRTRGSTAEHVT